MKKFVLLILLLGLMVGCNKKNNDNIENVDKPQDSTSSVINYEVKETGNGQSDLYINSEKFNQLDWNYYNVNSIYNIGDLLLVSICTSECDGYFINGNRQIVGMIDNSTIYPADVLIKSSLQDVSYRIEKVEQNDLYVTAYKYSYQDGSSVCKFNDEDVVRVTEKYTYLGNNKFSDGVIVESITKKQLLEIDSRFSCNVTTSNDNQNQLMYEVKNNNGKGDLYINGKLFNAFDGISYSSDKIYIFDDLLLVGVCRAVCEEYFVNADGEVIGNFLGAKMMAGGIDNFIKPKYHDSNISYWVEKVEGNDIYVTSFKYNYQDGSSICNYAFDEEVRVTEKFTYLGNYRFSNGVVVESKTKQDVLNQDQRFKCSTVSVPSADGTITIDFDELEKKLIKDVDGYKADIKLTTRNSCSDNSEAIEKKMTTMDSITKVINKLKSAKKIEYAPTSRECVLYRYSVGSDLIVFEADDDRILLASINGDGFAFHYDDSVIDFFKSL